MMSLTKCPKKLLTAAYSVKGSRGFKLRTIRDSFLDRLKLLIDRIDPRGNLKDCRGFSRDKVRWAKVTKGRNNAKSGNFDIT